MWQSSNQNRRKNWQKSLPNIIPFHQTVGCYFLNLLCKDLAPKINYLKNSYLLKLCWKCKTINNISNFVYRSSNCEHNDDKRLFFFAICTYAIFIIYFHFFLIKCIFLWSILFSQLINYIQLYYNTFIKLCRHLKPFITWLLLLHISHNN